VFDGHKVANVNGPVDFSLSSALTLNGKERIQQPNNLVLKHYNLVLIVRIRLPHIGYHLPAQRKPNEYFNAIRKLCEQTDSITAAQALRSGSFSLSAGENNNSASSPVRKLDSQLS